MKAKPIWRKAVIAIVLLATVGVLMSSIVFSYVPPSKEEIRSLAQSKQDLLRRAAIDASGRHIDRQHADTANLKDVFAQVECTSIDARNEDGSVYFIFDWAYFGDTTIMLCYLPTDLCPAPDTKEWSLTSSSENAWRWDGGGMMGKGYYIVERLQKNWFYIEGYYPM